MSESRSAPELASSSFALDGREMLGVFLVLQQQKSSLDPLLSRLLRRMEQRLFEQLTIDEFENLAALYRKKIEFEPPKD
jgi:hypothetical protein